MAYYPLATSFEARYVLDNVDFGGARAVFNDPADPDYVGALTEVTGLDSPEVRESAFDLTESDGGSHGYFYLGRRPIVLTGAVFGHASVAERAVRLDRARRASLALRNDTLLSWKPRVRLENLVTNPRAQNDLVGWSGTSPSFVINSGASVARVTGVSPPVGTTAVQISTTTLAGTQYQGATTSITLNAGVTYGISAAYRRTAGTGTGEILVSHSTGAGSGLTLTSNATAASWTTVTGTFTPTVTGSYVVALRQPNSNTIDTVFQISDVMVSPGTTTTYRDGDTAGWFWNGDSGNTSSGDFIETYIPVRRQQPFRESGNWVKTFQIPLVAESAVIQSYALKHGVLGVAQENRGNYPAYPEITIVGPSTNPSVTSGLATFQTTGLTLASGETVRFNMLNHSGKFTFGARAGQSANRYINWVTTGWPNLAGNGFTTTLTLSGGGSGTFTYRDSWA